MPELVEAFNNELAYGSPTWVSEWVNVSSSKLLAFSVFSDKDHTTIFEYAVDSNHDIIETDVRPVETGGDTKEYFLKVKTRFIRLKLDLYGLP
jgi:hypothetical protein